jgi:hypothetical protein
MRDLDLIFLHIPKTAGVAFRGLVSDHYGENRVFLDYAESPANPISPCNLDPAGYYRRVQSDVAEIVRNKRVVYGHFPILKYRGCDAFCATFLRDPIERALSQYYFWKYYQANNHPLHAYFLEMDLTVLEFIQLPHITGFYSKIFFPEDEIRRFDFVGDFSRFGSEAKRLGRLLGASFVNIPVENSSPDPKYTEYRDAFLCDGKAMAAVRDALRDELTFYEANVGK